MSYKSYKVNVKTDGKEKLVRVKLNQGVDVIKILSLELNTEDTYQLHDSNYGVIVGRVLANGSYGIPNVRVSVFIPLDNSENNMISELYPFSTMQVRDGEGKKYNVLPNDTYGGYDGNHKSIGSFPNKRLVLDNDGEIEVFDKYWKYTTVTNDFGDYMIFGVPTGVTQVHIDCDISDIGILSQRPYDMIAKGYDSSLFKSMTEFKTDNLDSAPQIFSQNKTVNVFPFWGNNKSNRIGITRCDIKFDYDFTPCCIFMGSTITDASDGYIGVNGVANGSAGFFNSLNTSMGDIEVIRKREDGSIEALTENVKGIIDGNGVWCYQIPMNLDKIGMDNDGNIIQVNTPGQGIPTRTRVRMRISLSSGNGTITTAKMLVPCNPELSGKNSAPHLMENKDDWDAFYEFGAKTPDCCFRDMYWNKVYSVKGYYPRIQYGPLNPEPTSKSDVDYSQMPINYSTPFSCIASICPSNRTNAFPYNTLYSGAENGSEEKTRMWFNTHLSDMSRSNFASKGLHFCLENDWVNGCLYLPNVMIKVSEGGFVDYFGRKNDEDIPKTYNNIYITGRHELLYSGGRYKTHKPWAGKWNGEVRAKEVSRFSQVRLPYGIVKSVKNSIGASVYYYRCGDGTTSKFYRLYATDIINLGNLNDVLDNMPHVYEKLPSTTAVFPPIAPPKELNEAGMSMNAYRAQTDAMWGKKRDEDNIDIYLNKGDNCSNMDKYETYGEASSLLLKDCRESCYSTSNTEVIKYTQERSCVFFGYKARVDNTHDYLHYLSTTFVNTSRICELDVENDHVRYGSLYYKERLLPINGMIDRFDITNNQTRSEFASLNVNPKQYTIEENSKRKCFIPTNLYMVDFDGRLMDYANVRNYTFIDEDKDESYVLFRYGDTGKGPMKYAHSNVRDKELLNSDLILTENSFYFYFGLNSGFSALDKLYGKYHNSLEKADYQIDNAIDVEIITNDSCEDSTAKIKTAYTIVPPFSYYLYEHDTIIAKGVNPSQTMEIEHLQPSVYKIEITDTQNHTTSSVFEVIWKPITMSYIISPKAKTFNVIKINGEEVTNVSYSGKRVTINSYNLDFDCRIQNAEEIRETNQIYGQTDIFTSALITTEESNIKFTISKDTMNCSTDYELTLNPEDKQESISINGIPVEMFNGWESRDFESCKTEGEQFNWLFKQRRVDADVLFSNKKTPFVKIEDEKTFLSYISTLMGIMYRNEPMRITYDGSSEAILVSVSPYERYSPKNNVSLQISAAVLGVISLDYIKNAITDVYNVNGFTDDSIYLNNKQYDVLWSTKGFFFGDETVPTYVGNNYPYAMLSKKYPLKATNNNPLSNNLYLTLQEDMNNSLIRPCFGVKIKVGKDENGNNIYKTYPRQWELKTDVSTPGSEALLNELIGLEKSKIQESNLDVYNGLFSIPTVDMRMDYEFYAETPLLLPSGLSDFTNLDDKTLINGHCWVNFYGGLTIKRYESDGRQASFYKDDEKGYVSAGTSGNIVEGESISFYNYMEKSFTEDYNEETKNYTNSVIEHSNGNGAYVYNQKLKGSECANFRLIDCSNDISDGYVKEGNVLDLAIGYESGVEFIHENSESYDLEYKVSLQPSKLPNANVKVDNNNTIKLILHGDTYYNGTVSSFMTVDPKTTMTIEYPKKFLNNGDSLNYSILPQNQVPERLFLNVCSGNGNVDKCATLTQRWNKESYLNPDSDSGFLNSDKYFGPFCEFNSIIAAVDDDDLKEDLWFEVNESTCKGFGEYSYLTIPVMKFYHEFEEKTLLKQGLARKLGCVYYASKLNVFREGNNVIVELYSPLRKADGTIDYSAKSLINGGRFHTVGEINNFTCAGKRVSYDKNTLRFTIYNVGNSTQLQPLYFDMVNGLRYKVTFE